MQTERALLDVDRRSGPVAGTLEERIVSATLRCIGRRGIARTTLDDIARDAGCSRATVYRVFSGGKAVLLAATWRSELTSFFSALAFDIDQAETLEDAIVAGLTGACRAIADHEALQYLLAHEPGAVLPWVAFDGLDPLLRWSAGFAETRLARFVAADVAGAIGPWVARLVVSYGFEPGDTAVDLTDAAVAHRFVRTYLLPGIDSLSTQSRPSSTS